MADKSVQINLELSERNKHVHVDAVIITFHIILKIPLYFGQIFVP